MTPTSADPAVDPRLAAGRPEAWWTRTRWRLLALVGLAAGVALVSATQLYLNWRLGGYEADFGTLLGTEMVEWLLWAGAAPVILWVDRRRGFGSGDVRRAVAVHVAVACAWFAAHNGVMVGLSYVADAEARGSGFADLFLNRTVIRLPAHFLVYGFVVGAAWLGRFVVDYHRKEVESATLSSRLARAQLSNLRMQLHPHFFFNTMHTIAAMVRQGRPEAAIETIAELSELLRRALETADVQEIPLDEELDFLRGYVHIQERRFGDRLRVSYDVDPETRSALVPTLLLQPLVENAIRHGLELDETSGRVEIVADRRDGRLHLEITDNGSGFERGDVREGVGLRTCRRRLRELYGENGEMEIASGPDQGTRVRIRLPYRRAGAETDDREERGWGPR